MVNLQLMGNSIYRRQELAEVTLQLRAQAPADRWDESIKSCSESVVMTPEQIGNGAPPEDAYLPCQQPCRSAFVFAAPNPGDELICEFLDATPGLSSIEAPVT